VSCQVRAAAAQPATVPPTTSRPFVRTLGAVVAVAVLVVVAIATLIATTQSSRRAAPDVGRVGVTTTTSTPSGLGIVAQHFLDAWRNNLTTSWAVSETLDRVTAAGRRLDFPVQRAQRPPDHLNVGLGTVDARLSGVLVACGVGGKGDLACGRQPGAPSFEASVDSQIATLETYLRGPTPLYQVAELAGCYQLTLAVPRFPVPPYGRLAVFCFDPTTGAPAGSVVAKDGGTDRTTVTDVHAPATDSDLQLPTAGEMTALLKAIKGAESTTPGG
jgi:hypothetical protein